MISVAMLGGRDAAGYYLDRAAGCAADYYVGEREPAGRWCGAGAVRLGLTGAVTGEAGAVFAGLLDGRLPDGALVAAPVWRADPRGLLPAGPLVAAVQRTALDRGLSVAALLGEEALVRRLDALAGSSGRVRVDASTAGRVAAAAGLDPQRLYRGPDGRDRYAAAVRFATARVDHRRAGLDVVVSAPKSVSVLYGLAGPEVAAQVAAAHDAAVEAAVGYLQTWTAHGLRGHHGGGRRATRVTTAGFVAAAFRHHTSRADDPQLHTHLVIANLLHGSDGRWSAVDSRAVHRHARTAGYLYQAVLRGQLTARLGVAWTPVHRGVAEVAGVPDGLLRLFSTRRRQIEAATAATGAEGRRARQRAAYRTRDTKTHTEPGRLRQRWWAAARAAGVDPERLVRAVLHRQRVPTRPALGPLAGRLFGPGGLTRQATSFDRRDVLQAFTEVIPAGLPVTGAQLDATTGVLLGHREVVRLVDPAESAGLPRYSTTELLAVEAHVLRWAATRTPLHPTGLTGDLAAGLSDEQRRAAVALLASERSVDVLVGPAGSGKTALLAAVAAAWTAAGCPVHGAALAAITAQRLEAATGIRSASLARLLADADRLDPATATPTGLPSRAVVVIDEASMVGTRALARALDHVTAAGGKLLLVGDPAQLPEIDAGGLFTRLARDSGHPAALTGNHRQTAAWERQALTRLRDGQVAAAVDAYLHHQRVHVHPDLDTLTTAAASAYLRDTEAHGPYQSVLLASRRTDAAQLTTALRTRLRAGGRLGPDRLTVPGPLGPTPLAVGDLVLVARNDWARGLLNGTRAHLTRVDADRLHLRTETGRDVEVPTGWAHHRLTHGYALTVHKAQGLTVATAHLFGTAALCQQAGYVALSRGRVANHLHTTVDALDPDRTGVELPRFQRLDGPDPAEVHDALRDRLARRVVHTLAVDQRPERTDPAAARSHADEGRQAAEQLDRRLREVRARDRARDRGHDRGYDRDYGR